MKVPSVKNAFHSMVEGVRARKAQRLDNLMKSHCKINDKGMSNEVLEQLETAQRTLGNYAHANDSFITINSINEGVVQPANRLSVTVYNKKNGQTMEALLDEDVNKIHNHVEFDHRLYNTSDETQIVRRFTKENFEDNFLRNLYRYVEIMTNHLKK